MRILTINSATDILGSFQDLFNNTSTGKSVLDTARMPGIDTGDLAKTFVGSLCRSSSGRQVWALEWQVYEFQSEKNTKKLITYSRVHLRKENLLVSTEFLWNWLEYICTNNTYVLYETGKYRMKS